jgi:UDP-3-O-[3-hydroxymyristoyl] N-acetylglucosamine deacetylase
MVEGVRILVVDDDESIRETFAMVLESEGYLVETAKDGKEAIDKINASCYDLALFDFRLPDMTGLDILSVVKEETPNLVKIMVSGYPSPENSLRAKGLGVVEFMQKPVDIEYLLCIVKKYLKKQREDKKDSVEEDFHYVDTPVVQNPSSIYR